MLVYLTEDDICLICSNLPDCPLHDYLLNSSSDHHGDTYRASINIVMELLADVENTSMSKSDYDEAVARISTHLIIGLEELRNTYYYADSEDPPLW